MITREGLTNFLNALGAGEHEIHAATKYLPSKRDALKMDIEKLLNRLHKVKKIKGDWQARCPAHDDIKTSLSIGFGAKGRILLCCQAGCPTKKVLQALNLGLEGTLDRIAMAIKVVKRKSITKKKESSGRKK